MFREKPDGAKAWLVAFSACIINFLLCGVSRLVGYLYVEIIAMYGVTREEATFPFSLRTAIRGLSGPLVGIVGQSYGIRTVTFGGGLMAAAGAALCCIAPNITWLAVFWGGIHGLGFAFANTLFQVVVNQYFQKYRATASGIALSGACVGSLAFPFMIEEILDTYGLAGGFLILGGVVMHVLPPALILKSPPWVTNPIKYAKQLSLYHTQQRANTKSKESVDTLESEDPIILEQEQESKMNNPKLMARQRSLSNNIMEELIYSINTNHLEDKNGIFSNNTGEESFESEDVVCTFYKMKLQTPKLKSKCSRQISIIPEEASDHTLSVSESVSKENGINPSPEKVSGHVPSVSEAVSEKNAVSNKSKPKGNENSQTLMESIKSIGALYRNPVYVLISACMSTYIIVFIPILTVTVDYSNDKGIPVEYGKYLINAMAIGDLAGRLGFGWVTDKGIMTIPVFMATIYVLQGVFIALFPMASSLYSFMAVLFMYGMSAGSMLVLFPVLVLKYVDLNSQSVAMACVGFLSGIVSFFIPPLIGYFRDTIGSYDGMFYLTGGISVISGGTWLLEPIVVKYYYGENFQSDPSTKKNTNKDLEANPNKETKSS